MLIKSWTGEEVCARARMDCKLTSTDIGENGHDIVTITSVTDNDIELDGNCWLHADSDGGGAELTLLHAPFVVGDLVINTGDDSESVICAIDGNKITVELDGGEVWDLEDTVHANPALRDSPDYKP